MNGKGSRPRNNWSQQFRDNYDKIFKKDMKELTFKTLREYNKKRIPLFKNNKGEAFHNEDGSDWSLDQWMTALTGEVGEIASELKRINRKNKTLDEVREDIANELADVQIYLDILAMQTGVDLGAATIKKWNAVSDRYGINLKIPE